jgi:glyoxylase-like metal-dependent hydrolase (beta-lactamase superfamily II)
MNWLRAHKKTSVLLLLLLLSVVTLVVRDQPMARAAAPTLVAGGAPPTGTVKACWAEYARNDATGQAATAGLTRTHTWDITVSGLLVRHPKGDLVVDVGNSQAFEHEIEGHAFLDRTWLMAFPGSNRVVASAPDALGRLGVKLDALTVLPTHAHVDHMGGLVDLPAARVLLPREELAWTQAHRDDHYLHVVGAHARALDGRTTTIEFALRPYETFDESADLFGDGSVVVVKLFGHTPGSVGVFVNVSHKKRMFLVGDAVNVMEAIERRLTKSIFMASTDNARDEADRVVAKLAALHEADPELEILPAHDRTAWLATMGQPGRCVD